VTGLSSFSGKTWGERRVLKKVLFCIACLEEVTAEMRIKQEGNLFLPEGSCLARREETEW